MNTREREVEFWDRRIKRIRTEIQNETKESLIREIMSKEHWWEGLIPRVANKRILDIGCGNSRFTAYWEMTGNRAYGIDLSPETIKTNISLHRKIGIRARFLISSAEKMPFKDNCFDIANMEWIVHHIPKELMSEFIEDTHRIMKENGLVLMYETNYLYPFRWIVQTNRLRKINLLRKIAIKKGILDPDEKALTNEEYMELLTKNGFKIIRTNYESEFFSFLARQFFPANPLLLRILKKVDRILSGNIIPTKFSKDIMIVAERKEKDKVIARAIHD